MDLPPEEQAAMGLELDCDKIAAQTSVTLGIAALILAVLWASSFLGSRLSETIQDTEVDSEDQRIIQMILRNRRIMQDEASEFQEFICKRLDDIEDQMLGPGKRF